MVRARYIFCAGSGALVTLGGDFRTELWIGVAIVSERPVDLQAFSVKHGLHLIPAEGLTEEELASVGISTFREMVLS